MKDPSQPRPAAPQRPAGQPETVPPLPGEPPTVPNADANPELPEAGPAFRVGRAPTELPARFGRYRLERLLGKGGMGAVYLAYDSQLDRQVALKIPSIGQEDGPLRERFLREARAAATLHHPNLCPVYNIGEQDGIFYLTMAYIEGKPLSQYIRQDKPIALKVAAGMIRILAQALQEAHDHGIIHRDLKPANILIDRKHKPIITDFGLARRAGSHDERLTNSGALMGTPAYMPPEQVNGDVAAMGPGCDIYALGVILYELLTCRRPFEGPMGVLMAQIVMDPPRPPSELRPEVDPALEGICLKALAKRPQERYPSMTALAYALETWQGGGTTPAAQSYSLLPLSTAEPVFLEAVAREDTATEPEDEEPPVRRRKKRGRVEIPQWVLITVVIFFTMCVLPSGGIAWLIFMTVNKVSQGVSQAGRYIEDLQKKQKNDQDRREEEKKQEEHILQELADTWKAPPADAGADQLFPPAVGDYKLGETDTKADVADLNVAFSGRRAVYRGPSASVEVFVYRASPLEKEAILRRANEALTPKAMARLFTGGANIRGSPQGNYMSYSLEATGTEAGQAGMFWSHSSNWLFFVRSATAQDSGPFLKDYLLKISPKTKYPK
jgi:predicted Ser/Thr protein kinase